MKITMNVNPKLYPFEMPTPTMLSCKAILELYFDFYDGVHNYTHLITEFKQRFEFLTPLSIFILYEHKGGIHGLHNRVKQFCEQNDITDLEEITGPMLTLFKLQVLK